MIIKRKEFQNLAIEDLISSVAKLLDKEGNQKLCVFQSPTGSGKTVMVAKFIDGIIKELPDIDMCFLWVSIGKGDLHVQSKNSLEKIFNGFPSCGLVEEEFFGTREVINQNEVIVANWEKLRNKNNETGEWKNNLMKDSENINFIEVLQKTKKQRKIILIIDESHYAGNTERTNELREIVNSDITLEMSATPKLLGESLNTLRTMTSPVQFNNGDSYFIYVKPQDVIDEGMIKKELIINEGIENLVTDETTSQDIIFEAAFNKREELKKAFENINSTINPLCLIQLPNAEAGDTKRVVLEAFLKGKGITQKNGKLAVWLSGEIDDFGNLDEISRPDNNVEFLIFKQAIDTGWDCPRASILIKLRQVKSYTFEIQTVGRILRMPEQKHYEDESLNIGYIFTNLTSIVVGKEEYNPNIIKHLRSVRKDIYQPVNLQSYYKSRVDFGDITLSFQKIFEKVFCEEFGIKIENSLINIADNVIKLEQKGLICSMENFKDNLLINKKIQSLDFDHSIGTISDESDTSVYVSLSEDDLQDTFNNIIKENLNGFAPKRSIPTVRQAIYNWFKKYLGIKSANGGFIATQNLFLHPQNIETFSRLLAKSTDVYKPIKKEEVKSKIEESYYDWNVKNEEFYNQYTDEKVNYNLCIYEPCYLSIKRSEPERDFEKYIDSKHGKIVWWYKNGAQKKDFFGVKYIENDLPQTFYPDFVIKFVNGKIGLFDTKDGITAKEAKLKAEALHQYIEKQKVKGFDLIGGIVIEDESYKWRLNNNKKYTFDRNDLTQWKFFDEIF